MAHEVEVKWGSKMTREEVYEEEEDGHTYSFDTEAEKDAFLQGLAESKGWTEHKVVDS